MPHLHPWFHRYWDNTPEVVIEQDSSAKVRTYGGNDQIFTGDYKDKIYSGGGDDFVYAGGKKDWVFAGWGDDIVLGGSGRDTLFGGSGADLLNGGEGRDKLLGGWGNDALLGDKGNDILIGGWGDDYLVGGSGRDTLIGGQGRDSFHLDIRHGSQGYEAQGKDTFIMSKHDSLVFHGVHNLTELSAAITRFKNNGHQIKIRFEDGSQLKIKGLHHSIDSLQDLENAIDVQYTYEYRTIDGYQNNLYEKDWGQTHSQFLRLAPADYGDGFSTPAGASRPSARIISNELFDQSVEQGNPFDASDFLWLWGQFLDHDLDIAEGSSGEVFNIEVPLGDPFFDPYFTGTQVIPFTRTEFIDATGVNTPREHENGITSFVDASNVYGSTQVRADFLRNPDGSLKTSDGNLLPYNNGFFENAGGDGTDLFIAGDVRANENSALASMHTLFVREHNRIVEELRLENPDWHPEQLYNQARIWVSAQIQAITYNEFLPKLLGVNALSAYSGYDENVNPNIATEFSSAAYRLGHTLLSSELELIQEDGSIDGAHLALRDAFFNTQVIEDNGIESILRGAGVGEAETLDLLIIDEVRNFLFGPPGSGGLDLGSLNVQRGRDHGLADYNSVREAYGLNKVVTFADITSDAGVQAKLASLYGSVDDIDLFVGALAEDAITDSMLGELLQAIIVDQFTRVRDGDRFWYQEQLSAQEAATIDAIKLSDIIEWNTDITHMQQNVFDAFNRLGGDNGANVLLGTASSDLILGFDGNDILQGMGGEDELAGGAGNDVFVINVGASLDTILDFALNSDGDSENDTVDVSAFGIGFGDLTIAQHGQDTLVTIDVSHQVVMSDIDAAMVTAADFNF